MAVPDLTVFSREGIGFVEQENRPARFGGVENRVEVFLR
jgi:hypothetical protein